MKKNRIFKVKFETNEGREESWITDQAHILEEDGETAIAKAKKEVEKRGYKFRLTGLEELARADY